MSQDQKYIERCLQLAAMGSGHVAPNPLVGAVIVHDGKIIGEGYHQKYGAAHAEVNAIATVKNSALLRESTMYVSLEPCAHHGKTPPCADLLVQHAFKRVVIGCKDSFSEVSGKGIERLQAAGIEVTVGVLEAACRKINRHFFTFHERQRPYILLKWAQTSNHFMDSVEGEIGKVTWISAPETQVLVHQWRSEHQAILVGKNTVMRDNPSLTVRAVEGRNPIRIVLDSHLSINSQSKIMNSEVETFVVNLERDATVGCIHLLKVERMDVDSILNRLYAEGIQSILIEGGRQTIQSFLDANLWDEARIITAQKSVEQGTEAPSLQGELYRQETFFTDQIAYYWNQ